jgi:1-deoxy-D-xylulose-5-phosphate synthase
MVLARDHLQQERKVIAVIGDGGLTGGMALEAINHLGYIQKDVIIILNDNEMSISENVGGFSQYMKRIRETFFYKDIKRKIDFIEDKLDQANLNPAVKDLIQIVKKEAKDRFDTPGIVFEKLGVNYSGPIDGHDLGAVVRALDSVKDKSTPQIIHIITRKGKGYAPAEADAIKYHGVPAFALEPALAEKAEPSAISVKPKPKSYSDVFTEALIDIADIEPNMVAITPATAEGSGLVKFGKAFPDRFFDVAICEQHAVTMAAGMAKLGVKPVVSIYSTFLQRAMDQVIHDVAIMNLPVVFGIDRGGLVEDGETHQGVFDIAFLRAVPNFTVLAPKDARELRNMLYTALKESKGPVAIRFPREKAVNAQEIKGPSDFELIDLSQWSVLSPGLPGCGVLLAFGSMVETAIQCLPELSRAGLEPMVVAARSAKPLDEKLLQKVLSDPANRVVTLEEGQATGGFGAAVMEYRSKMKVANPSSKFADVVALGVPDNFVEHGARQILLDQVGLSPARVTQFLLTYLG